MAPPLPRLRLDADLHVRVDRVEPAAALARAAALGLTDLGLLAAGPDPFDAYAELVRAAGTVGRPRVHCGLELRVDGGTDPDRALLRYVDYVLLVAGRGDATAVLHAAAGLSVAVVVAGPVLVDLAPAALARAGIAAEVTERWRTPGAGRARALADAGVPLVAGSAARAAAAVGRWQHVATAAAALAPEPHRAGTGPRTAAAGESSLPAPHRSATRTLEQQQ